MLHRCSDTREIASSQHIKATLHDGSQLLAEINATTKIKVSVCARMHVCVKLICAQYTLWPVHVVAFSHAHTFHQIQLLLQLPLSFK